MRPLVDVFESALGEAPAVQLTRDELESLVVSVWALGLGYGMARDRMWARIGRERSPERDLAVRATLRAMVRGALSRNRRARTSDAPRAR